MSTSYPGISNLFFLITETQAAKITQIVLQITVVFSNVDSFVKIEELSSILDKYPSFFQGLAYFL